MNPNPQPNLMSLLGWIFVLFALGGVALVGVGCWAVLFVHSLARAADSLAAMFRAPLTVRHARRFLRHPL
jgi:hypothetical protein